MTHSPSFPSLLSPLSFTNGADGEPSLVIRRAKGVFVEDDEGRRYLDGMAGVGCVNLGYGNEEIAEVAREQIRDLSFWHLINGARHEGPERLAERLRELAGGDVAQVFFCSSGSEANDTQVKLLRYVNKHLGRPERRKIVAHEFSYHGCTSASMAVTGNVTMRQDFGPDDPDVRFVPAPSHQHLAPAGMGPAEFSAALLRWIETLIEREDPSTIAGYFAEPCMAAGGMLIPPEGFHAGLSALLARHDIPLIADDVVCAFGRLGGWFGSREVGMAPASTTVAKGLSSAYAPIAACLISEPVAQVLRDNGAFWHGFTYSGHPLPVAIALKTLEIYERDDVFGHVRRVAPLFERRMRALEASPIVGIPRARGLFGGFDIFADPASRRAFDAKLQVGTAMRHFAREEGVLVRNIGEIIALCPPLVITEEEIGVLFDGVERALARTVDWLARERLLPASAA